MDNWIHDLPTVNATLNATATLLLVWGYRLIKPSANSAQWVMLTAFAVSILFLACYLTYHSALSYRRARERAFCRAARRANCLPDDSADACGAGGRVPVLAGRTIYLGYRDRRVRHRRWAHWTFPIWLYVSITGVVIYLMLYHLYPPPVAGRYNVDSVAETLGRRRVDAAADIKLIRALAHHEPLRYHFEVRAACLGSRPGTAAGRHCRWPARAARSVGRER